MFLLDPLLPGADRDLVVTATDVLTAARCEYQVLRILDERLGRTPKATFEVDEMRERAGQLGDEHEQRVLAALKEQYPDVVEIGEVGRPYTREALEGAHAQTLAAMRAGADVVFQGSFFDGVFHGRADFLVRTGPEPTYAVWDSKLARSAKTEALLQLAAYAEQIDAGGIVLDPVATLVLGDGSHAGFDLGDLQPVFTERRDRLLALVARHRDQSDPVAWGNDQIVVCGRCDYCAEQVTVHRDVLGVHRVSLSRRRKYRAEGIRTIEDLARTQPEPGTVAAGLRDQARMQAGLEDVDGSVQVPSDDGTRTLSYRVLPRHTLGMIPPPDPGDVFFDFEGDPLFQDEHGVWGLEYLFGVLEAPVGDAPGVFRPFLAHSRKQEAQALTDFLDYLRRRREQYPHMHVYHYANYEKAALRRLSMQHVVGEAAVDELLREVVLVDLYDVVQTSLRLSEKSYGLKALEPLYMGTDLRTGDVKDGGASVTAYANYCMARDAERGAEAEEILASIIDYNHYDCRSTLGLRDWLIERAAERSVPLGQHPPPEPEELREVVALPQEQIILAHVQAAARAATEAGAEPDDEVRALALIAAAVSYHRREDKQYWWGHFDRLDTPIPDWAHTRDVFVTERAEVLADWSTEQGRRNPRRTLRLRGALADGSLVRAGSEMFAMYHRPLPQALTERDDGRSVRGGRYGVEVLEVRAGAETSEMVISEGLPNNAAPYPEVPMALTPPAPIGTKFLKEALADLASAVAEGLPAVPDHPAIDLLRRRPPRLTSLPALPPVVNGDYAAAITTATRALADSYLAVQGPPGSGKTWVGARVISALVAEGWKIGVVGQSHAVVENLLRSAIEAGVPAWLVAKKPAKPSEPVLWEGGTSAEAVTAILAAPGGALIGGTAWTMTGKAVPAGSLDLLVIDEAGQFSLANTLAVSRATRRLLLLGDPQQLPQVSQGHHPEPVDVSALSWLSRGESVLPAELGYFLALTWRMHPELCRAVSRLSYAGALHAAPVTTQRHLAGAAPGVECRFVPHAGNTTSSPEEAAEVLTQVRAHLGLSWRESANTRARPLEQSDILVVAPYNAQVQTLLDLLASHGLDEVRVGTVDKFQGQQAPVVIVSTTVSAVHETPRGMEFVLNRNRMNVAISRGQWRAVIVRSPDLTDVMPYRPEQLADLGAFIALCQHAPSPAPLPAGV